MIIIVAMVIVVPMFIIAPMVIGLSYSNRQQALDGFQQVDQLLRGAKHGNGEHSWR